MLIAQMYHMDGNAPDAMLAWGLGALLAALLVRSNAALAAAFVLFAVWTGWERALSWEAHWLFLGPLVAAAAVAAWLGWRPGLHLAALSLVFWLVPLGFYVLDRHAHWLVAAIGVAVAVAATVLGERTVERRMRVSHALFAYGVVVAFAGLFIIQFIDDYAIFGTRRAQPIGQLAALAALTLVLLVAAIYRALVTDNRGALWLGYIAFTLQIFALYWKMLRSLLDTSLFFLIAALIVSALAWAAYRLHQRQMPSREAAA
jgi:uncharacterized membrane protein